MTYWVLPKNGILISTDKVQVVTQAELLTDKVKELQAQWKEGTRRIFEAATVNVNWERVEDFDPDLLFDLESEDEEKIVGYKRITGNMVFDVKLGENFQRKARFMADGHLTEAPASMTYSTVVSRDSVRILLMIAALNRLDLQCPDIQNAFLTAPSLKKCYMNAGPEFMGEEGKTFIVRRALYGLKSAALAFRSFLAQKIKDLGFFPLEADPDVLMRPAIKSNGAAYYKYILCYVDDIMCMSVNAMETMKQLQAKFKFKKDLIEPPRSYLGAQVGKKVIDGYSMWTISSFDYVQAAVKNVEDTIKDKKWALPGKAPTPMASAYKPELDGTGELGPEDHKYYQELIGVLRWATELGRVDILHQVWIAVHGRLVTVQCDQMLRISRNCIVTLRNNCRISQGRQSREGSLLIQLHMLMHLTPRTRKRGGPTQDTLYL